MTAQHKYPGLRRTPPVFSPPAAPRRGLQDVRRLSGGRVAIQRGVFYAPSIANSALKPLPLWRVGKLIPWLKWADYAYQLAAHLERIYQPPVSSDQYDTSGWTELWSCNTSHAGINARVADRPCGSLGTVSKASWVADEGVIPKQDLGAIDRYSLRIYKEAINPHPVFGANYYGYYTAWGGYKDVADGAPAPAAPEFTSQPGYVSPAPAPRYARAAGQAVTVDPALQPIQKPGYTPAPLPYRLLPDFDRLTGNPYRQSGYGPINNPLRRPAASVEHTNAPIYINSITPPDARPFHALAPAGRGVKEAKVTGVPPAALNAFLGTITEALDFIDLLYKSVPYRDRVVGRPTPTDKLRVIYRNLHKIDVPQFLIDFLTMQAEDRAYAALSGLGAASSRDLNRQYGTGINSMLGGVRRLTQ